MLRVLTLPLDLANRLLEWLTGRIPTDVDLLERVLVLEAEREILLSENKILRVDLSQKVDAIKKRIDEQ